MSSEAAAPGQGAPAAHPPGAERRLHPLSWLFSLISQLKQFALPIVVLLFTGQRNDNDLWGLIGVGALVLVSIAQYFTYRYRIESDGVVIRSGLFQRSLRHIPFARIQNVTLHQTLLHRLFKVAEVRLESAGAAKPEGQMRVLQLRAAHELEQLIRAHGSKLGAAAPHKGDSAPAEVETWLALSTAEVVRLGLINNRGVLVIGGLFAVLAQAGNNVIGKLFNAIGDWLSGQASAMQLSIVAMAIGALLLLVLALVALRLFSVLIALLQFHGFRLTHDAGRLRVERGLLTRTRGSLPSHRIQAFSLSEGILHRWFGRRSLRVDSAVAEVVNQGSSLRDLVPLATPVVMDGIIDRLLPERAWPISGWQPLHPRAWRRKFGAPVLVTVIVALGVAIARDPLALALLGLIPVWYWRARVWARHSAYCIDKGLIAFRSGWLNRNWRFAETRKLQAVEWLQSPFDRRHGMATVRLDTAGASAMDGALTIPYLPEAEAREVFNRLSDALALMRQER